MTQVADILALGVSMSVVVMQSNKTGPYLVAILICILMVGIGYPGFMSFDSLQSLNEARTQVVGGPYPPFGSYVWRLFDSLWPGPTLMLLAQNAILLTSFIWILDLLGISGWRAILICVVFAILPPIFGPMLVVWKDVAVAACFMLAFALLFCIGNGFASFGRQCIIIALAMFFIFAGMAYRFNAASGALPLCIYLYFKLPRSNQFKYYSIKAIAFGAVTLLGLLFFVFLLSTYRFPTFEKLQPNPNFNYLMEYDLVGISVFSSESVVQDKNGGLVPIAYLQKIYDPRHTNITFDNDKEKRVAEIPVHNLRRTWLHSVVSHPLAYLQHHSAVFSHYIGWADGPVFYVTHPSVDKNVFGIEHIPSALTPIALSYIHWYPNLLFCRPWVYYFFSVLAILIIVFNKKAVFRAESITIFLSGLLYLLPMYFISPAADLRYNFWSVCASVLTILFCLRGLVPFLGADTYQRKMNSI